MTLSEDAADRLADIVALQPTKNADLQERWGLDSGSEVHGYLEDELKEYYYRDEDSLIRATPAATSVVDAEPGVENDEDGSPTMIRVPSLQARAFSVLPDSDERSESVVSVLHAMQEAHDIDPDADAVRSALRGLEQKGVVAVIRRTVPTFRLAVDRGAVAVEEIEED